MKNVFILCSIVLFLSCSKSQDDSGPVPSWPPNIEMIILGSQGEKLLTTGSINRDELVIEQLRRDGTYVVNENSKNSWCKEDKSGVILFHTTLDDLGFTYRITFPDQSLYYVKVKVNDNPANRYITEVKLNDTVVYTGDTSQPGIFCGHALQLNLIKE